jgi:hypothetical protein
MNDSDRIALLEARLATLEAQDAIRRLKARYMQWCDEQRGEQIADLFWEDGLWEARGISNAGEVRGAPAIAAMFGTTPPRLTFTVHYLTNESIAISGDRAVGEWKLFEPCTYRDEVAVWQGGRYVDHFERRAGEWRFSHLLLHLDFRTAYSEGWLRNPAVELP